MANREDVGRIHDDTATGNDRPPAGGKRRLIREGGSASRVSMHARPRDPGGGTVSTDPPRRTILNDVSVDVEQPREEPSLVSSKRLTVQTGQASAEDTHRQECPHDVIGLHAHKGTMWMSDDCVLRLGCRTAEISAASLSTAISSASLSAGLSITGGRSLPVCRRRAPCMGSVISSQSSRCVFSNCSSRISIFRTSEISLSLSCEVS